MTDEMEALVEHLIFSADIVEAPKRSRDWNDEEIKFLRNSMGTLTEPEIAAILGRPWNGVHLKRERLGIPATSKTPGWLTTEQARLVLGLNDGRRITSWVRRGMVKGHILGGPRKICMVHEISLIRFIVNPMNWPWFDIDTIRDRHLRRLIARQKERWGDEWLTAAQAGQICGLDARQIQQYVRLGRLTAVHTMNKDGRHTEKGRRANYMVLRSEVEKMRIFKHGDALRTFTPGALEWIRKALAMGWNATWIGRSMKRDSQVVRNWIDQYDLGERPRNMGRPKSLRKATSRLGEGGTQTAR